MVNSFWRRRSYALFPGQCQLCLTQAHEKSDICSDCRADLPWLGRRCRRCALPLTGDEVCANCLRSPPLFDECHAAWAYAFPVDRLIGQFKYQRRRPPGRLLAELWLATACPCADAHDLPDLLVPVPMHWRRLWYRGFNQATTLAQLWGAALSIPVYRGLKRRHHTPRQQGLDAPARRQNLRNAFEVTDPAPIEGRHIALVDDVLTTGATADNLAVILRGVGATRISVWCLARTL